MKKWKAFLLVIFVIAMLIFLVSQARAQKTLSTKEIWENRATAQTIDDSLVKADESTSFEIGSLSFVVHYYQATAVIKNVGYMVAVYETIHAPQSGLPYSHAVIMINHREIAVPTIFNLQALYPYPRIYEGKVVFRLNADACVNPSGDFCYLVIEPDGSDYYFTKPASKSGLISANPSGLSATELLSSARQITLMTVLKTDFAAVNNEGSDLSYAPSGFYVRRGEKWHWIRSSFLEAGDYQPQTIAVHQTNSGQVVELVYANKLNKEDSLVEIYDLETQQIISVIAE